MLLNFSRLSSRYRLVGLSLGCFVVVLLYWPELIGLYSYHSHFPLHSSNSTSFRNFSPLKNSKPSSDDSATITVTQTASSSSSYCKSFPSFDNLVVVVKTGATEAYDKLPTQILTILQCAQRNLLIFSDMDQDVAGHHVIDALDEVAEEVKANNPDFDLYHTQQQWRLMGQDIKDLAKDRAGDAWNLDKYKNVHVARKAWQRKPNKDWYLFIDADTYIVWSSLTQWLKRLDPKKLLYLGSTAFVGDIPFAHGGSGYMVSGAAMAKFAATTESKELTTFFDHKAKEACCGDLIMAESLFKGKVKLQHVWPMINGEKPRTLPFGPSHWCQPVVTMHHLGSEEIADTWNFELERAMPHVPLLLKDVFDHFMAPNLTDSRDDWDNMSDDCYYRPANSEFIDKQKKWEESNDLEKEAYKSFDDCGRACKADGYCYQWSFYGDTCAVSRSFKLGRGKAPSHNNANPDPGRRIRSGWDLDKIKKFRNGAGDCSKPKWIDIGKADVYYWEDKGGN